MLRRMLAGVSTRRYAGTGEPLGTDIDAVCRSTSKSAVSREVAVAMAEGGLTHSRADVVASVTGFAGPAGPDDEPGLVHFGCLRRGRSAFHREEHFGEVGRGKVREQATRVALEMMLEALGSE